MAKCHHYGNNPPTTPRTGTRRPHPMRTGRNQSQCPGLRCAGRLPTRSMWCSYNGQRCHLGGSSRPRYGPRSRPRPRSHPGRSPSSRRTPPSSPGSSAAPWLVGGDPGYGATPHVLAPSRSVPSAEGVAPPARPRHLLSPVPPAPAVSAPPRSDNGQPRGASYMYLDGYPHPGKTGFYYVDKSIETIISGWGR